MQIEEVMTVAVRHCAPETNLASVIELMCNKGSSGELLVVEHGKVVGIITERDICVALGTGNSAAREVMVRDIRITVVQTCRPGDDVEVAMDLMRATKVRLVPVVDEQGMLKGSVTLSDLIHRIEREPGTTKWNKLLETLAVISKYPVSEFLGEIETVLARKSSVL